MNGTGKETNIDENYDIPFVGNMVRKTSIFEGYCVKKNHKLEVRGLFIFETRSEDLESEKYFKLNSESHGFFKASVNIKTKKASYYQPKGSYRYYHVMTRPLDLLINSSDKRPPIFYRWTPFKCEDSTRCTHMVNNRSYA